MIVNLGFTRFAVNKSARDRIEYVPGIGNIAGVTRVATSVFRTLFGATVGAVEYAVTNNTHHHLAHLEGGLTDIARGVIATVPFAGNALMWAWDSDWKQQDHFEWDRQYRQDLQKIKDRKGT